MTKPAEIDFADIQGLVRFGYGSLTEASFLLLRIRDAAAARSWLATAPISNAVELPAAPTTALQVAFTYDGLRVLDISEEVLSGFSSEFCSGMSGDENRSRRLGDVAQNAPQYWQWGGPDQVPHLIVMLYARENQLSSWAQMIRGSHWDAAFELLECLPTSNLFGLEPFGFMDGISQPTVDWHQHRQVKDDQLEYGNLVSLGEFLLGYPNEYGKYTDRPLLPATVDKAATLPVAIDAPTLRDLGHNGTYLVLRQLRQDVRGFWQFVNRQANSDPHSRQQLAESMVGRTLKGQPLVGLSDQPIAGIDTQNAPLNQFTFDSDAEGLRCPIGAHIRRANPRTNDLPETANSLFSRLEHMLGFGETAYNSDVISSTRFHRLLRRGREYGTSLLIEEALQPAPPHDEERGIHFISVGANISRQFEFVQGAWIMSSKFGALTEESDPLLGNREPIPGCPITNAFSLPQENGADRKISGIPQFITVRGGAYFFLPSLSALRFFIQ